MPATSSSEGRPKRAKAAAGGRVAREVEPRRLTDPRAMRAVAHPLRVALLELLLREGPLTATQAADLLGDSPGNMSWHLQTLARYGFVEEAGGGRGRARPWRLVAAGTTFGSHPGQDAEHNQAATALERLWHDRSYELLRQWQADRHTFDPPWDDAGFATSSIAYLTATEFEELGDEIAQILMRYRDRTIDRSLRPADARPVQMTAFGHPLAPTPAGN